jgi:hypothetical protein
MDKINRLIQLIPQFYNTNAGSFLRSLLETIADSDTDVEAEIQTAKDQIFINLASGKYLEALGNSYGVAKDPNVNPDDDIYRQLISELTFYPKQVRGTIYSIIDTFWSPQYSRANINSSNYETYNLSSGLNSLTGTVYFAEEQTKVTGVGTLFTTELQIGDYIKLSNKSNDYYRVADIANNTELTISTKYQYKDDRHTATRYRPHTLTIENDIESVDILVDPSRIADIAAVTINEFKVQFEEKHSTIKVSTSYDPNTQLSIMNIYTTTIGIKGYIYISAGTLKPILGFSSTKVTFFQLSQKTEMYEINPNEIVIKIPAEVPSIRRTLKGSMHFQGEWYGDITAVDNTLKTITVDFSYPVTLNKHAGNLFSQGVHNFTIVSHPAGTTGVVLQFALTDDLSVIDPAIDFAILDQDTTEPYLGCYLCDPDYTTNPAKNIDFPYTVFRGNSTTGSPVADAGYQIFNDPGYGNPGVYYAQYTATEYACTLNQTINAGDILTNLSVLYGENMPNDPGYLVFAMGLEAEEGLVKYNGQINYSTLAMNPFYTFKKDHQVGENIRVMVNAPTTPKADGSDYGAYFVDSALARVYIQELIQGLIALGCRIRWIIDIQRYPHSAELNGYLE